LVDESTGKKRRWIEKNRSNKKGGQKMERRSAAFSLFAGLILFGLVLPLHAAAQKESLTFEQFLTLPKLETVTQEVQGNFADTKIEYMSFKQVDGIDRYYLYGYTGKGGAMGLKTLVQDYKSVRETAKNLMTKLCDGKKAIVESDLFYPTHFTTQFRCE
jgi:hypothetical protein